MPSTWEPVFMPLRKLHFWVLRNSRYPTSLQSCTLFLFLQAAWIASECRFQSTLRIQSRAFGAEATFTQLPGPPQWPQPVDWNMKGSLRDWRFPNKSPGESSIFNPGLQPNPERDQEMPEDEEMPQEKSPGECSIFNLESWSEDLPTRVLENLQSWIEDSPRRVLENLQSSILDWRFPNKSPGESSLFNLQSWLEDSPRRALENLQSSILDWRFPSLNSSLNIKSELQVWTSSLNLKSEHQVWTSQFK